MMICLLNTKIKFIIKYFITRLSHAEEWAVRSCGTHAKYP